MKLYIIHGWTYSIAKWQPLVEMLRAQGIEVQMLEVPGLTKRSSRMWTLGDYVDWLKLQLEAEANRIVLMGHSNGGRLALNFAIRYPNRIKQLILLDSAGVYHNELSLRLKRLAFKTIAKAGSKITKSPKLRQLLYRAARVKDYEQAALNMRQTMQNLISSDKQLDLAKINIQTTIIWGAEDKVTPLSDARVMRQKIKAAQLFAIPNATHSPQIAHAKEVADIILKNIVVRSDLA